MDGRMDRQSEHVVSLLGSLASLQTLSQPQKSGEHGVAEFVHIQYKMGPQAALHTVVKCKAFTLFYFCLVYL